MKRSLFTFHFSLLTCKALSTLLFFVAVLLFFGLVYPHHLHYQEQYQLFLFDSNYVWEIVRLPGGTADLLGRFCTQFFLYAWVGALIIAILLSVVQLLTLRLLALLPPSSFLLTSYPCLSYPRSCSGSSCSTRMHCWAVYGQRCLSCSPSGSASRCLTAGCGER